MKRSGFKRPELPPRARPALVPRSEPARAVMAAPCGMSAAAALAMLEPVTAGKAIRPHARASTTAAEHRHLDRVASLGCVLCWLLGTRPSGKTDVHHVREGQGGAQRAPNFLTIPLCHGGCHQGPRGIHGDRSLLRIAKVDELDLLAITLERLYG